MESDSAISEFPALPSTTLQPSLASETAEAPRPPQGKGGAADGETLDPDEYETASDSDVDDSNAAARTAETLVLSEVTMPLSSVTEDQNPVLGHEGDSDESIQKEGLDENADLEKKSNDAGFGVADNEEKQEGGDLKVASSPHKLTGKTNFEADEPADIDVNGDGLSREENDDELGGDGVGVENKFLSRGYIEELDPKAAGEDGPNEAVVEPKLGEVNSKVKEAFGFEDAFSSASSNLVIPDEVEPKDVEAEHIDVLVEKDTTAWVIDSVYDFGECVPITGDDLELKHDVVGELKPIERDATGVENVEPPVGSESKPDQLEEVGSINNADSELSIDAAKTQDSEAPELDVIKANAEVIDAVKGEEIVEYSAPLDSYVVKDTEGKFDKANRDNFGESIDVNCGLESAADDRGNVNSAEAKSETVKAEFGAIHVAESETVKADSVEAVHAVKVNASDESHAPMDSDFTKDIIDKLDEVNDSNVSEGITSPSFGEGKVFNGSENFLNPDRAEPAPELDAEVGDGEFKSGQQVDNQPVIVQALIDGAGKAQETIVESSTRVREVYTMVEPDANMSLESVAIDDKDEVDEDDGRISDRPARVAILDSPETAKQIIREMERISSSSHSGHRGSQDSSNLDGQIVSDSDEPVDSDDEGGELFDSAALAALLKAATGASDGTVTVTSRDAARIFSVDRPAGLGASAPSLRPAAPRSSRSSLFAPSELAAVGEDEHSLDDDDKKLHEKVEHVRVKFLRLVQRLGHSPEDTVVAQVLYRLNLAEGIKRGRQMGRAFSIENAKKQALQLEEEGKDDLNFSCNILVLGKTGVGKSATINSIFGAERSHTDPFQQVTTSVREIAGVVDGVTIRVIDTPGLKPSILDQASNRKILSSIKRYMKRCPPDIVLYVDRMDTQTRDFNDLPLLRSITSILGSSIWFNAIVALTHAASAPPDGPNGSPLGYEVFIAQRSHVVQQSIRQAAGDMRLMNPVALVENHPSCRRNREGERVLPNGLSWRPQLLLLCYSSKILSEANSLLKLQDPSPGKLFGFRLRSPPLPFLLSSLLQSRTHPKLSGDQAADNVDSDVDLDDLSDDVDHDEEDEYDQLPPFKPLGKAQIAALTKEQRKAYFDEYDYRIKLLQKKQWKEELRRLKDIKKKGKDTRDDFSYGDMPEDYEQGGGPAAVQVPLPDMVLPPSFDCDNPAYRYRFLEPTSQLLTRPVLDTHGWDHDCGYDGVSIEESLAIVGRLPTSLAVQITKDKKEFNIHLDSSLSAKHGEHGSSLAGFDIQSVGKQLAYILRGETKFKNLKRTRLLLGFLSLS
ncbi:hypothetical protein HPP92_026593 [Vanilla planifolia]|uniref:AIG1-type G domain-containing protein n=1 Tax=Vanilla planifolia TaxID=51239 RepID=A0A835UWR3_VANPL|nr:hypothetical protein HPP92_026593 [Vanilla planifolia]KAG0476872.1 hypothetical protein HPP92_013713 [Vanilla planifolia]